MVDLLLNKMDDESDFSSPVFNSARERVSEAFRQMIKPPASAVEQDLYVCYKCGSKNILSVAKQVRSCDEGTSVFNSCNSCGNRWRDG